VLIDDSGNVLADAEGRPIQVATPTARSSDAPAASGEPAETPRERALREENARLRAEQRQQALDRVRAQAEAFADRLHAEDRILPAERSDVLRQYAQACLDDAGISATAQVSAEGTLSFADGEDRPAPSRARSLESAFSARPPHGLTSESVVGSTFRTLPHRRDNPVKGEATADDGAADRAWAARRHGVANGKPPAA
jgi:hypothetical protein